MRWGRHNSNTRRHQMTHTPHNLSRIRKTYFYLSRHVKHLTMCMASLAIITASTSFAVDWDNEMRVQAEQKRIKEAAQNEKDIQNDPEFQRQIITERQLQKERTDAINERETFRLQQEAKFQNLRNNDGTASNSILMAFAIIIAGACIGLGLLFGLRRKN